MKLEGNRIATSCINHEALICVRESLKLQDREIIYDGLTAEYPDVHGKIFTEFVVVFKSKQS